MEVYKANEMISRETILKLLELEAKASLSTWTLSFNHDWMSESFGNIVMEPKMKGNFKVKLKEDGEFIVASRNHLKDLCDSYLELLDENEKGRELLKQSIDVIQHGGPFVVGDKIQKFLKGISE